MILDNNINLTSIWIVFMLCITAIILALIGLLYNKRKCNKNEEEAIEQFKNYLREYTNDCCSKK